MALEIGDVGLVIDEEYPHMKGYCFIVCSKEWAHIIGKDDGWSNWSRIDLKIIKITEEILESMEGVINATK